MEDNGSNIPVAEDAEDPLAQRSHHSHKSTGNAIINQSSQRSMGDNGSNRADDAEDPLAQRSHHSHKSISNAADPLAPPATGADDGETDLDTNSEAEEAPGTAGTAPGTASRKHCTFYCDDEDRQVAKVMVPLVLFVILTVTLGLVLGGAFKKGPAEITQNDLFRAVIGSTRPSGELLYQSTWDASQQDPNSPQAKAYAFLQNDAISNQLLAGDISGLSRTNYHRVRQRFALASFFFAAGGSTWKRATHWLDGNVNECEWYTNYNRGEVCAVTYRTFWLLENNLTGSISHEFFDFLSSLRDVSLSYNELNGTLDDMVGPRGMPRLSMKSLRLNHNNVSGTMDRLLKYFSSLEILWLQHNFISGTIPPEIGGAGWLHKLDLSFNQISGTLPSEMGRLTGGAGDATTELYLDNNLLSGTIPEGLGNLGGQLKDLWLHNNQLEGSIPSQAVRNWTHAKTITLANNQLTGSIPTELLQYSVQLRELDLSNNELTGKIGSEIGLMLDLEVFRAANNSLSGTIPTQIANCRELEYMDLRGNSKITGSIPESLCSISSLMIDCTNLCGCYCGSCANDNNNDSNNNDESSEAGDTEASEDVTVAPSVVISSTNASDLQMPTNSNISTSLATTNTTWAPTEVWWEDDDDIMMNITNTSTTTTTTMSMSDDVCYFVLAGQSNVLGFADLGHLEEIVQEEPYGSRYLTLMDDWVVLEDVFVSFDNEYGDFQRTQEGRLTAPSYGTNRRHFGLEVGFGFEMADLAIDGGVCGSIVLVKTAGVAALATEWNAPNGAFFQQMIEDVKDAMERKYEVTGGNNGTAILGGLVWFHGYADVYEPEFLAKYGDNLVTWIEEARQEFSYVLNTPPDLPIVIGQMGGQGLEDVDDQELEMRTIQADVVAAFDNAKIALTNTSQFVTGFNTSDETQIYDEHYHYYGRADVIINVGEQLARDMWSMMQ